ncbi:rCG23534 [Rattus norvegicus]|uniref:RCG23534 n=1 Tax=Rattus norvegicus TaxID=10116 RepID=A6KGL1_RAT|nr:rCG23534 [Rattus norvegicus]
MKRLLCSLLGLLCIQVCWQQVQQSPASLVLQEGENAELQCNFSTSTNQTQWFYQSPGGSLVSLFFNPGMKRYGRLMFTTVSKEHRSSLTISSSQTTDSGTYFCVVMTRCFPGICSPNKNLQWGGCVPSRSQDNICII